jgi:phage/plasmid primase-like uncharacterized protein
MGLQQRRLDRDQVRHGASVVATLDYFGKKFRGTRQLRTRDCPACGQRSSWAVSISAEDGLWLCHAHGCRGDLYSLVAGYAGLDVKRDFSRVLELTTNINGLDGLEEPEVQHRIAERRRLADAEAARHEAERQAAVAAMPSIWESLDRRNHVGEKYLAGRGIPPRELRLRGDIVRYSAIGEPAVALRDLGTGEIVGIQYRRFQPDGNKLRGEPGSQQAGAALYGRIVDLDPDGVDVAVIAEGLADTLAACLVWPGCAVIGSPGAGQLERVAAAIAPRVAACGGWLLISVDNDDPGIEGVGRAIVAPVDAGLHGASTVRLVQLGRGADGRLHHDLADAYQAGWRWRWPS